jgi:dTDP-4-amino-4,6-dideoxygalactose transaminase
MKKKQKVPFTKVPICGNELKYIKEVLKSGWLTSADKAILFEQKFAKYIGAKYACAVNSCTAALHLGIEALGVKKGDKVFVQAMTFTASAEVIRYLGANPIFLDIEYGSNLITPDILKEAIKNHPDVKYLIIVHYGGQAAQMTSEKGIGILDICKMHGIKTIEDAAHAFPCKHNGRLIGTFGDVTCFSFYANKTITSGEGGMLVTDKIEIYHRARTMRLHGISKDIWDRFTSNKPSWEYDVIAAGYKYNMPDINAAIGLAQLELADTFRNERQKAAEYYFEHLSNIDLLDLPIVKGSFEDHAWHLFPIVLNENSKINRNEFIERMFKAGISTSVHYKPLYHMTYYRQEYNLSPTDFPNTEKTWRGNISLPIYPYIATDELYYVYNTIKKILKK